MTSVLQEVRRSVEAVLALAGAAMSFAASPTHADSPYAPFVKSGAFVHVSSIGPTDAAGVVEADDVAAQARRTLENLRERLAAAGTDMGRSRSPATPA